MTACTAPPARGAEREQPQGPDGLVGDAALDRTGDRVRVEALARAGFRAAGPGSRIDGRATVITGPASGADAAWVAPGWRLGLPDWLGVATYVGVAYEVAVRTVSVDPDTEEVVLDKTSRASDERMDVAVQRALEDRLEDWGVREFLAAVRGRALSAPAVVEKAWTPFDVTTLEITSDHPLPGEREVEVVWLD